MGEFRVIGFDGQRRATSSPRKQGYGGKSFWKLKANLRLAIMFIPQGRIFKIRAISRELSVVVLVLKSS